MARKNGMTINLVIQDKSFSLSPAQLRGIVSHSEDVEGNQELFDLCAQHESASVREEVASKDNISETTCRLLSKDAQINVVRCLMRSRSVPLFLDGDMVLSLIDRGDVEVLESIANYIERFENISPEVLGMV